MPNLSSEVKVHMICVSELWNKEIYLFYSFLQYWIDNFLEK